jgi:hypothetical protein
VGLAAATGAFIDDLIARAGRYGTHLFVCFDDPRIPATTNELEGFFGGVKGTLRRALGCGSTSNSIAHNLGADALMAYQQVRRPDAAPSVRAPTATPADFCSARAKLNRQEAPAIRRRSMVRHFKRHVDRLRRAWLGPGP